jgi:hypothetical protein
MTDLFCTVDYLIRRQVDPKIGAAGNLLPQRKKDIAGVQRNTEWR